MGETGNSGSPRRTRCRTGCLRCRVRRRKCDEAKPQCRNCIEKGFQCRYGSQLTFLTKNVVTVSTPELPRSAYSTIKFVSEDPKQILSEISSRDDEESLTPTEAPPAAESRRGSVRLATDSIITATLQPDEQDSHDDISFTPWAQYESENAHLDSEGHHPRLSSYSPQAQPTSPSYNDDHHSRCTSIQQGTLSVLAAQKRSESEMISPVAMVSDKDEFAARGLLALIASEGVTPALSERLHIGNDYPHRASDTALSVNFDDVSPTDLTATQHSATQHSTTEKTMELLRHYRYEVAPWLDLCDMSQFFGILAFQLSMESEQVVQALLSLSEVSLYTKELCSNAMEDQNRSFATFNLSSAENICDNNAVGNNTPMTTALTTVFQRVNLFVSNLSRAWSLNDNTIGAGLLSSIATDMAISKPTSPIYWLLLRLELSTALANDETARVLLSTPLPWEPSGVYSEITDSSIELVWRLSNFAHRPLMILAQAMRLKYRDGEGTSYSSVRGHVESWKNLVDELERWRRQRPEEFRPVMELPSSAESGSTFSTVLFTNGPSIFGNQLYHTAMLLLLLEKPRTVRLTHLPSFSLSPLWHAQYICRISLNNDRRECWDPCLLASFLFAAKRMTHELQQQDILQGLNRIQSMTGWNIQDDVAKLQGKWRLLNAV